jgi:hypothetical protein
MIPLLIAYSSYRNGFYTCDANAPASMASSDRMVQIKHRVTVFPLALECSYTIESHPLESDYETTRRDLGTAWWAGAPVALLAATGVVVVGRRRGSR